MRKLTSITAGWLWLAVAFGLSTLVGMGVLLIFFLAGCQDAAHAQLPSLQDVCYTGGRGDVIRLTSNIVLLTLMAGGTLLATVAAGRHLAGRRRESPQAWALLTTTLIAAVVASSMVIRFLPYNGSTRSLSCWRVLARTRASSSSVRSPPESPASSPGAV
jgi:hypothetical protein